MRPFDAQLYTSVLGSAVRGAVGRHGSDSPNPAMILFHSLIGPRGRVASRRLIEVPFERCNLFFYVLLRDPVFLLQQSGELVALESSSGGYPD